MQHHHVHDDRIRGGPILTPEHTPSGQRNGAEMQLLSMCYGWSNREYLIMIRLYCRSFVFFALRCFSLLYPFIVVGNLLLISSKLPPRSSEHLGNLHARRRVSPLATTGPKWSEVRLDISFRDFFQIINGSFASLIIGFGLLVGSFKNSHALLRI